MAKVIGPTFSAELAAAGLLGLPMSWGSDGVIEFDPSMTEEQQAAVLAVYQAHDPDAPPPPSLEQRLAQLFPDLIARNALFAQYPLFRDAIERGAWGEAAILMADAVAKGAITPQQAAAVAPLIPEA